VIRVLIADDHAVVRRGVSQILSEVPDIFAAGEASTGQEVLQAIRESEYDVVILDIGMPEGSGIETLNQLRSLKPEMPILIFSIYPEEQYAIRTLKAGAAGYVTKDRASEELVTAIRKVFQGGKYITHSLAERLAAELGGEIEGEPHQSLSDREFQVMCFIATGNTVTDIANELSLSVKTISTYRTRILEKLDLRNNAEIIRYALKHGLVD